MTRELFTLVNEVVRERALRAVITAPLESRIEIRGPARSPDQNARLWAMLSDIAKQLTWHGQRLETEEWKLVFLDGLKRELRLVPAIDGSGFVPLGRSSSNLTKAEFNDLFLIIENFAAEKGVLFRSLQDAE